MVVNARYVIHNSEESQVRIDVLLHCQLSIKVFSEILYDRDRLDDIITD